MVNFTIAIPTYNGAQRLPRLLDGLRSQKIPEQVALEVLVIDNNSTDATAEVVANYQRQLPYPLRYVLERQQGAAFARKRAVHEAAAELIGFLDDDNFPEREWVSAAWQFALKHPAAGVWASRIQGEFEVPPSEQLKPLLPFLALTDRGSKPRLYAQRNRLLPPSAGLVVRKRAWLDSVPPRTILSGRVEGNMLTGEDTEVLSYIQRKGWEIWYNPEMQIAHQIPQWRLEKDYLIPFFRGIGLSRFVTRTVGYPNWKKCLLAIAYFFSDLRKILLHVIRYRSSIKTDLVAACQMELFVNSLISPFYLYRKGYFKNSTVPSTNSSSELQHQL